MSRMASRWREIFKRKHIFIGSIFIIGMFIGALVDDAIEFTIPGVTASTPCVSNLQFIKPNINCDVSDQKAASLSDLQDRLRVLTEGYKNIGKAKRIGIFVRDLTSNRFAGVNDNDVFYMASFLKIPVLIGGYKLAEVEPRILDQEIQYDGTPNLYDTQIIKPKEQLVAGTKYTIRELMHRAIVYSDNTAAQLLFNYYPSEFIDRILQALGIQITRPTNENENLITARTYAGVFRMLYNSSYLTEEYSNSALKTLSQSTFSNGATAKLPSSVVVAHKFAERTGVDPQNPAQIIRQVHECGIVYAKDGKEPYSFCILTEGDDYTDLEEVLQDTSLDIYNAMVGNEGN